MDAEKTEIIQETDNGENVITPEAKGLTPRSSWNFSLNHMAAQISDYPAEAKQLIRECFLVCVNDHISRDDFAKQIGYDGNTVYKVFTGRYLAPKSGDKMGPPEKMVKAMRAFILDNQKRAQLGTVDFVKTPTAKRIFTACDMARESRTPVFIWGRSHLGKTWALENYARGNNHGRTIYIRLKSATGLGGMLHRIAEKIGVSPKANKEDIIERIKKALAPNQVLIIDEVHLLLHTYRKQSYFACLEVLREIYDEVGCGMVLCGTLLFKKSVSDERNGDLEQFYRRGVHKFILPNYPTAGDVKAVVEHYGLEFPARNTEVVVNKTTDKPYDILQQLAKADGFKAITERLRYARKLAGGKPITWTDFVRGHLIIGAEDQSTINDWE